MEEFDSLMNLRDEDLLPYQTGEVWFAYGGLVSQLPSNDRFIGQIKRIWTDRPDAHFAAKGHLPKICIQTDWLARWMAPDIPLERRSYPNVGFVERADQLFIDPNHATHLAKKHQWSSVAYDSILWIFNVGGIGHPPDEPLALYLRAQMYPLTLPPEQSFGFKWGQPMNDIEVILRRTPCSVPKEQVYWG